MPAQARLARSLAKEGTLGQLVRGGAAGAVFQFLNKVLALAASALLARALGVEGYGLYAFAIALTGMASIAAEMGMGPLTLRETARAAGPDAPSLIGGQLRAATMLVLGIGLILIAAGSAVVLTAPLSLDAVGVATLLLALPLVIIGALTRIGVAALAGLKRLVASQAFEQVFSPLLVCVGAAALYLGPERFATPQAAMLIQVASGLLAVLFLALTLRRYLSTREHSVLPTRELVARGWPFLMIGSALVLNQQLDTLLVGIVLGTGEVGPYRVASQGAQLAMFMAFVINTIISPYVARYHADGDLFALRKLFVHARAAGVASVAGALALYLVAGEQLIALAFGTAFVGAAPLLAILTAGYLGNALAGPCGTILAMTGHERASARALWTLAIANGVLTCAAGALFGLYGVATVTALTITLYQGWLRYILWRELKI